ncbi:MAG: FAD-binding protein [Jatrophihabitantaceae bacterium]
MRPRAATVGAGVRWREVVAATAEYGLVPLPGSSSDVSAVGYTLGGGLPVMSRTFGFAADRVRALDVLTAGASPRHVDASSNPELFWGLCGGKGKLGIVTANDHRLVDVATVYGGGIFYPTAHIPAVLHAYPAWAATLGEQTSSSIAILRLPRCGRSPNRSASRPPPTCACAMSEQRHRRAPGRTDAGGSTGATRSPRDHALHRGRFHSSGPRSSGAVPPPRHAAERTHRADDRRRASRRRPARARSPDAM